MRRDRQVRGGQTVTSQQLDVVWAVAFQHALSLICTPQRFDGALTWSSPSDEQIAYVRAWAGFVVEKARGTRVTSDTQVTALARALYQAYGAARCWRRAFDQSLMRRWSTSDAIAEGEPKSFGGASKYALNDGSSAGELERDAWHAVAQAAFEYNEAAMHGSGPVLDTPALARVLYQAYSERLGGRSSYATHEKLDPWVGESEERAWQMVARHAKETLS